MSTFGDGGVQVLRRTKGSIELVDASELLPGLKRTPGLHRWRPFDKQKQAFFDSYDDARAVRASPVYLRRTSAHGPCDCAQA